MTAILVACAAFFGPPTLGLIRPAHMAGIWLTAALCAVAVCAVLGEPLGFAAAVQSVILAVVAVAVSPPYPSRHQRQQRRRENRAVAEFVGEVEDAGMDLVERVWNAPRPRIRDRNPADDV